jgi:regulator of sigma E protease
LAIVLFAASFMAGFPAVVGHPSVTGVEANSTAAAIGIEPNDLLVDINGQPVRVSAIPDFDYEVIQQVEGDPTLGVVTVLRDGAQVELPLGQSVSQEQLLAGVSFVPVLSTEIIAVAEDSPALAAGLQANDLIYSVNDTVIGEHSPLNEVIGQHLGEEITLTLLRGDEWVTVNVTPRANPPEGQGSLGVQIGPASMLAKLPLLSALWEGVRSTAEYVLLVLQLPVMLLAGTIQPADAQLTGPVGIAQMVGGAVSATIDTGYWFPIWRLSAVLSAALAITNLLPLPALDGGRLLFILFEVVRGRRVNPEREGMIHMVGFMLLLGLLVLVTVRDITTAQQGIDWISILGQ